MGIKISKNYEIDKPIKNIEEFYDLAINKKSVYVKLWKRTSPAAFIINMPFMLIYKWTKSGMFYNIKKIN